MQCVIQCTHFYFIRLKKMSIELQKQFCLISIASFTLRTILNKFIVQEFGTDSQKKEQYTSKYQSIRSRIHHQTQYL